MFEATVNVRGVPMTLAETAEYACLPYKVVYRRYFKKYVRDEEIMDWPDRYAPRKLRDVTDEEIRDLSETRACWKGMRNGWHIACDLLGVPRCEAKALKKRAEAVWVS